MTLNNVAFSKNQRRREKEAEDVPTLESEGLTEEDLYNPDDIVHPQQS